MWEAAICLPCLYCTANAGNISHISYTINKARLCQASTECGIIWPRCQRCDKPLAQNPECLTLILQPRKRKFWEPYKQDFIAQITFCSFSEDSEVMCETASVLRLGWVRPVNSTFTSSAALPTSSTYETNYDPKMSIWWCDTEVSMATLQYVRIKPILDTPSI